jgi:hypothetical protein
MPEGSTFPESPFAKYKGCLQLGDKSLDCYVLDNAERVLSLRGTVEAIAGVSTGKLDTYIGVNALTKYIDTSFLSDPEQSMVFNIPGGSRGSGITSDRFEEICKAYVSAYMDGRLETDRQREIASRCWVLVSAFAKVGLVALIDEATGYQEVRSRDALQVKLRAFIADELREWEKTFPDELWEEFGRLTNWRGPLNSRPKWWGKLVLELVYDALDPDIAEHLRSSKPKPRHGQNYHQWLTGDVGLKALTYHIQQVIGIAKTCQSMDELKSKVAHYYRKEPMQLQMSIPGEGGE